MSPHPDPEAILLDPDYIQDVEILDTGADVIDIQPYLGEQALGATAESPRSYAEDMSKIEAAREDPERFEALLEEYSDLIRLRASAYFLIGGEKKDLVQEGMFGFYKSVKDYDGKSSSFYNFAMLCITRQVITAVKTATRQKHGPLNSYVSFATSVKESDDGTLEDILPGNSRLPEDILIQRETLDGLVDVISTELSWLEYNCLKMYLDGENYQAMAQALDVEFKSVDNALQRVRRKVAAYLEVDIS